MISLTALDSFRDSETGCLTKPLTARQWRIPDRIELKGEKLFWHETPRHVVKLQGEILEAFLRLANASSSRILEFAKQWGVLELCKYDCPPSHPPLYWLCPVKNSYSYHPRMEDGAPWEPVTAWRRWAQRANATLNVAGDLYEDKIAREEEWRVACWIERKSEDRNYSIRPKRVEAGWRLLALNLNYWLELAEVRPYVDWAKSPEDNKGRLSLPLMVGGLFGALATQLVLAISRTDGLAICSGCGVGYVPSYRRPRAGERHYCKECRDGKVPQRDAARDHRSRKATYKPTRVKRRKAG